MRKNHMTKEQQEMLMKIYNIYSNKELCEMFDVDSKYLTHVRRKLGIGEKALKEDIPEGFTKCRDCGEILSNDNFYMRSRTKPELGLYNRCKDCGRVSKSLSHRDDKIKRHEAAINEFKINNKGMKLHCRRCNKDFPISKYNIYMSKAGRIMKTCSNCNKNTYAENSKQNGGIE